MINNEVVTELNMCSIEDEINLDDNSMSKVIDDVFSEMTRVDKYILEHKFFLGETNKSIYEFLQIDKKKYYRYYNRIMAFLKEELADNAFVIEYMANSDIKDMTEAKVIEIDND